jgi:uncharacterized integral membrane protein
MDPEDPIKTTFPDRPAAAAYYEEHTSVPRAAAPTLTQTISDDSVSFSDGTHSRRFSIDTEDIVAIGAIILCIGAVLAALIVALGFVFGKVQGPDATKIILGCVGGATISALVGKFAKKGKKK